MGSIVPRALVYAAHGFLGQPEDWCSVQKYLDAQANEIIFIAADFFSEKAGPVLNFQKYADLIINKIEHQGADAPQKIFLGYSLGGRLGLHLLQQKPNLFDEYIFLSTNAGFTTDEFHLRESRIIADHKWSEKISSENWTEFIKEWNAQSVLAGGKTEPLRKAEDYDLLKLKESFLKWSLGQQDDFSDLIATYKNKITWVVGTQDSKYIEIAEGLKKKNCIDKFIKVLSGHRIWLDNPEAVAQQIIEKLKK